MTDRQRALIRALNIVKGLEKTCDETCKCMASELLKFEYESAVERRRFAAKDIEIDALRVSLLAALEDAVKVSKTCDLLKKTRPENSKASLEEAIFVHVANVLRHHGWNQSDAAKTLQIDRKTLRRYVDRLIHSGVEVPSVYAGRKLSR